MLDKFSIACRTEGNSEGVALTYDVRIALQTIGKAVKRNPALFGEMIKRGVPARLLLSQILELMLVDKKGELEVLKATMEFVRATGDEMRQERKADEALRGNRDDKGCNAAVGAAGPDGPDGAPYEATAESVGVSDVG